MKQRKQQCFVQLRIVFQYIKKQTVPTNSLLLEVTRLNEHTSREDRRMYQHLSKCENFAHTIDLLKLHGIDASTLENSLLTLLFLTFVFWTPTVTGTNGYF